MITEQEILDKVYLALKKQGKPSADDYGDCFYDDGKGNKCAAGHLLTDKELAMLHHHGVNSLSFDNPLILETVRPELVEHTSLILSLQHIHDSFKLRSDTKVSWLRHLNNGFKELAKWRGLKWKYGNSA